MRGWCGMGWVVCGIGWVVWHGHLSDECGGSVGAVVSIRHREWLKWIRHQRRLPYRVPSCHKGRCKPLTSPFSPSHLSSSVPYYTHYTSWPLLSQPLSAILTASTTHVVPPISAPQCHTYYTHYSRCTSYLSSSVPYLLLALLT